MQIRPCLLFLTAILAMPAKAFNLILSTAPINAEYRQATTLLAQAYQDIGINLKYTQLPYTRSAVSANVGVIDGLDLRLESHAQSYPNLVKVNVPLLMSKTVVVINRKLCPKCGLSDLRSLGSVSGFSFRADDLNLGSNTNRLIKLAEHDRLFTFFKGGRVNAIITSDLFLPDFLRDNDRYRYIEIGHQPVYHYLYKNHKSLAQKLEEAIRKQLNKQIALDASEVPLLFEFRQTIEPSDTLYQRKENSALGAF